MPRRSRSSWSFGLMSSRSRLPCKQTGSDGGGNVVVPVGRLGHRGGTSDEPDADDEPCDD